MYAYQVQKIAILRLKYYHRISIDALSNLSMVREGGECVNRGRDSMLLPQNGQ